MAGHCVQLQRAGGGDDAPLIHRHAGQGHALAAGGDDDVLGLPNPFDQIGFPYIQNIGFGDANYLRPYNRNKFVYDYWIFDDNATKILGKHELQFGVHARIDLLNTIPQLVFYTGQIDFNNFNDFLLGAVNQSVFGTGINYRSLRTTDYSFFVQDDWRLSRKLTLNLGLRYELDLPPYDTRETLKRPRADQEPAARGDPAEGVAGCGEG
jgi:outer membrane receptor protein involved in Fe transport